jgi:LmbE family N-acetylglucosaminyl deacetylase
VKVFLSPHHDDETLFGAFTLLRERPLVVIVTDSYAQFNRGDGITNETRWAEARAATEILGCEVSGLGIRDDRITLIDVVDALRELWEECSLREDRLDGVYAPAIQHGHPHHDLIGQAALQVFRGWVPMWQYSTYSPMSPFYANHGEIEVKGKPRERELKARAMDCYRSQYPRSWRHFKEADGKSEWLTEVKG